MATARMAVAMSITQSPLLLPFSRTNFTRNGAVLRATAPTRPASSLSCSFLSLPLANSHVANLSILARATEVGSENAATEAKSEDIASETKVEDPTTEVVASDDAAETKSEEVAPAVESEVRAEDKGLKLYVGNLPWACDSTELAEICQDFGVVETVEVVVEQETGRSRGFAFVTMASNEDARAVIKALDGSELGGRTLKVDFPRPSTNNPRVVRTARGMPGNDNKVFVSNFPWACEDDDLKLLFSGYGEVVDAKVVYDRESGRSRGFGFVTMGSAEELNAAIENLNGADYQGRELRVALVERNQPRSPSQ